MILLLVSGIWRLRVCGAIVNVEVVVVWCLRRAGDRRIGLEVRWGKVGRWFEQVALLVIEDVGRL